MIICYNYQSAHLYNDVVKSNHELRYQAFVERMKYDVPHWQGMEYDCYDNLSAHYLVWRDKTEKVCGTCRLAPTERPYMLKDIWPDIVTKIDLPQSPLVWEASRLCVDKNQPSAIRRQIINELVCAYQHICLLNDIEYMVGVMPPNIWERVFHQAGWEIEMIGDEHTLDTGEVIIAGKMNISEQIFQNILRTTGLKKSPLIIDDIVRSLIAEPAIEVFKQSQSMAEVA